MINNFNIIKKLIENFLEWWGSFLRSIVKYNMQHSDNGGTYWEYMQYYYKPNRPSIIQVHQLINPATMPNQYALYRFFASEVSSILLAYLQQPNHLFAYQEKPPK